MYLIYYTYVIVVKISDKYTMNNNVESNDHLFVQRLVACSGV